MSKKKKSSKSSPPKNKVVAQTITTAAHFAGPIPPPSLLDGYEAILPGSADRILSMAEKQSSHRMELENKVIDSKIRDSQLGMLLGFCIAFVVIVIGGFLIYKDKNILGFSTILTAMVALVSAFIYGTNSNRKERENKTQINQ